jgi:hypothetical protein
MKKFSTLLLAAALAISLMACSAVKKLTGQRDDSILPGTREEILPPEAQTARDPGVTGKKTAADGKTAAGEKTAPCNPDDLECVPPPIDQESSTAQ